jgi:hypothetical protein
MAEPIIQAVQTAGCASFYSAEGKLQNQECTDFKGNTSIFSQEKDYAVTKNFDANNKLKKEVFVFGDGSKKVNTFADGFNCVADFSKDGEVQKSFCVDKANGSIVVGKSNGQTILTSDGRMTSTTIDKNGYTQTENYGSK